MAGSARVFGGSGFRPGKTRKVIVAAATLVFLGLMGILPAGAAGQGMGQDQGALPPNQGALTQNPQQDRFPENEPPNFPLSRQKQRQALLDSNYKKLKKHAEDLAELADSLQKEIEKSNENVLSLEIVKKAEQVEKLARKIRNEAKGY